MLQRTAPELNEDPLQPFTDFSDFQLPALRIADNGEDPIWMIVMARGTSFGDLNPSMLGAQAMVLEMDGHRIEEISREGLNDLWDMDLSIAYSVQEDDSADVVGKLTMGGVNGAAIREAISQLSPQEVDQALRQLSSQMVKGLDLRTAQVMDMEVAGGPLIIDFDGAIPDFVQRRENSSGVRLRIPELGLADGLGPTERQYTLVIRASQRVRTSVQLDTGPTWTLEYGPENSTETRDGFRYEFTVEKDAQHLMVRRTLEMRGATIPAEDFPGFIANMKKLENQETRAVRLVAVAPVESTNELLEKSAESVVPEEEATANMQTQETEQAQGQ
jgi:hypothetical protein